MRVMALQSPSVFQVFVGQVVKVSKGADGKVKIDKVWAVMDCGWFVNPDIVRQQLKEVYIMALGAADNT
jgi:isoquinoline 1-oxidoreductase beta subunit